jgi:glutamine amidotransferase
METRLDDTAQEKDSAERGAMCRLFGFRSVIPSQVHSSLVGAENALARQGVRHGDGWGVAYYQGGAPHVIKSAHSAVDDSLFRTVSGIVASETVVAHLRKATVGELNILDTHPFQFGRWVFAHNGNIQNFSFIREELLSKISRVHRRFILGKTDSEVMFFLIISRLAGSVDIHRPSISIEDLAAAAREAIEEICQLTEVRGVIDGPATDSYFSFVMTNGETMLAHHGGQTLHVSTYKKRCAQRKICPYLDPSCEAPSPSGYVNHLILASEALSGENIWTPLSYGEFVGVDARMLLHRETFDYSAHIKSS